MSERYGLNGGKASDWLRLYAPNWAVSNFEGGVRLMSSDGRDCFSLFGSLFHPDWRESEAQLTEKQAVLLMHDIYIYIYYMDRGGWWVGYYNFPRSTNKIKSFDEISTSEKNYIFLHFSIVGESQT